MCVLQDAEDVVVPRAHHISLAVPPGQARQVVRAAARMGPHHFVVTRLQGGLAAPVLEAMVEGTEGVLASLLAPTLRHGLSRLVAQLVLTQPGLALDAARELVGESFDLALEVGVGPDGKARVLRVAELTGSDAKGVVARDVFVWASDGGAGSFNPTGVVPRIATELQARGTKLDPQTFKRASK